MNKLTETIKALPTWAKVLTVAGAGYGAWYAHSKGKGYAAIAGFALAGAVVGYIPGAYVVMSKNKKDAAARAAAAQAAAKSEKTGA